MACLDQNCQGGENSWYIVDMSKHGQCKQELIVEIDKIDEKLDFNVPDLSTDFNLFNLKNNIKRQIKKLKSATMSMAEACDEKLKEEVKFIDKAKNDNEYFLRNLKLFHIKRNNETKIISVSLRNWDDIKRFANRNELEFNSVLNETIENLTRQNLHSIITRNLTELQKFNSNVFSKYRSLFERIRQIQPVILSNLFLSDLKNQIPFSFNEAFESINSQVLMFKPKFECVNLRDVNGGLKETILSSIKSAFRQTQISFKSIEQFIVKDLQMRCRDKTDWEVKFVYFNFPKIDEKNKNYEIFMCNNFYISVGFKTPKTLFKFFN
jgi:hypothetical protein